LNGLRAANHAVDKKAAVAFEEDYVARGHPLKIVALDED